MFVQGACEQLRSQLHQANQDCAAHSREAESLRALQEELHGRAPSSHALIQAAIAQEKAQQETRNLRVLNLLRSKVFSCPFVISHWTSSLEYWQMRSKYTRRS